MEPILHDFLEESETKGQFLLQKTADAISLGTMKKMDKRVFPY